ncbi:N-acetylmuramoyl-L-alanine amidase [Gilvimarinus polysaccharolyticus]|uniref:N-acetylmuramoyl-L-alanine amidase n=1 Tax=Gilvimarinus polysaccharolyticus TaxID=863921 RepID=UPI0006737F58|nr:N-acetylmuramoyl-L-alanine amidase [Gilvimarinus polysaccharolyticus]
MPQTVLTLPSSTRRLRSALLWLACVLCLPLLAHAADVDSVRLWRAPDHTRLVFDLSGPVEHTLFTLSDPNRVVIDVSNTQFHADLEALNLDETPIKEIRYAPRDGGNLRVVLDLSTAVNPNSFFLPRQAGTGDRLVVDLKDRAPTTAGPPPPVAQPPDIASSGMRDIIIAIDAGHGGEDPGASGPNRLREKDVVLKIAQELAKAVNGRRGYVAKLVRTGDYYVPLRERRNIARKMQADLFISIHADAFTKPSAKGASVFALSRSGATSEMARFLAQSENESDLIGGVGSVSLEDKDEVLAGVLVDLSMTATLGASLQVGDYVLKSMGQVAHLHKHQVEQAGFAVLKSPDVPSILVETGFISNPAEAKNLANSGYRTRLAAQLLKGIEQYFNQFPPPGTYLANKKFGGNGGVTEYTIARGDTLSEIAKRFNISVSQLQQLNNLNSQTIKVGQTLRIPTS